MGRNKDVIFKIVSPFIVGIVSLMIAHNFNPFSAMNFIPKDKAYDVCITIYFSAVEVIFGFGIDKIEELIAGYYMEIEAILSHVNEEARVDSKPTIRFNAFDVSEVELTLNIRGERRYFNDIEVVIPRIAQADYQLGRRDHGASINSNGDYCIKLSAICGHTEIVNLKETFLVTLQRAQIDNSARVTISPEARPSRHRRIKFLNNAAVVKLEERS